MLRLRKTKIAKETFMVQNTQQIVENLIETKKVIVSI